ncbi:hypothetical protein M6B38_266410 [Iris pallida]|uniref:Uncharacterized protein n=1 Tax=Iris pallida TaxID=29817 RepID=A0AAX6IB51_IRIPA|nr:hypothetical protein M6B38_266410 [Iris pallida]
MAAAEPTMATAVTHAAAGGFNVLDKRRHPGDLHRRFHRPRQASTTIAPISGDELRSRSTDHILRRSSSLVIRSSRRPRDESTVNTFH